jgi:hypothetical protein
VIAPADDGYNSDGYYGEDGGFAQTPQVQTHVS